MNPLGGIGQELVVEGLHPICVTTLIYTQHNINEFISFIVLPNITDMQVRVHNRHKYTNPDLHG